MIYNSGNEPVCETTQYIHDLHNLPSYSPSGYGDTTALLALELEPGCMSYLTVKEVKVSFQCEVNKQYAAQTYIWTLKPSHSALSSDPLQTDHSPSVFDAENPGCKISR